MPPIWISPRMTHLPNMLNDSKGTVRTPVTQVEEVAVKTQSNNERGVFCASGNIRRIVPKAIVRAIVSRIVLPGESVKVRNNPIRVPCFFLAVTVTANIHPGIVLLSSSGTVFM